MTNDNFELEEMRQQMAILKQKLHQQEILNDRMTSKAKEALEKDMDTMGKKNRRAYIFLLLALPLINYSWMKQYAFSTAFHIFFSVYVLVTVAFQFWNKMDVHNHMLTENLLEAQRKVSLTKKHHAQWIIFDYLLCFVFIAWMLWEVYQKGNNHFLFIILIVFFSIGVPHSIWGNIQTQRRYQKMLDQIADLTAGNEMSDD